MQLHRQQQKHYKRPNQFIMKRWRHVSLYFGQVTLSIVITLVSKGDVSYACNDQVIDDLARYSEHNSEF